MSLLDKASIVLPRGAASKANEIAAWNPQAQEIVSLGVTQATSNLTRVNEQGLIESVAANVLPRDFVNGGCGEFNIWPQRTNLFTYSEDFNNADWSKFASSVTANNGTSPDGTTTADKLIADNTALFSTTYVDQTLSCSSSTTYAISCFAKEDEFNQVQLLVRDSASFANRAFTTISLVNGSIVVAASDNGDFTAISSGVTSLDNGWYRVYLIFTTGVSTSAFRPRIYVEDSTATQGDGTSGILIWGAQIEQGSYATAYIPTSSVAETR